MNELHFPLACALQTTFTLNIMNANSRCRCCFMYKKCGPGRPGPGLGLHYIDELPFGFCILNYLPFAFNIAAFFISKCEYLLTWIKICVWYHFKNTTTSDNELLCELRMMLLDMRFTIYITFCLLKYVKLNWHEDLQCWSIHFVILLLLLSEVHLIKFSNFSAYLHRKRKYQEILILTWISLQKEEWY